MTSLSPAQLQEISIWASIALTFGLLVFAAMQWWVTRESERQRLRERRAEADAKEDAAHHVVWAEQLRISNAVRSLDGSDLVLLAAENALDYEQLLPRDSAYLLDNAVLLGQVAPRLVGVAIARLHDARAGLIAFDRRVRSVMSLCPPGYNSLEFAKANYSSELESMAETALAAAKEAALTLSDALRCAPRAETTLHVDVPDTLESGFGKRLLARARARKPLDDRSDSDDD